jgi:shikimate dehydrogenase
LLNTKQQWHRAKSGGGPILSTSNLAVIGSPIAHSKSPQLHLAAYRALGLDWSYERLLVEKDGFDAFVGGLDVSWRGLSVTMPHKVAAFAHADAHDSHALYTNAVNTLSFSHAGGVTTAHGYNTDVFGISSAVRARGLTQTDHATVVGAGATAQSALVALDDLGFQSVTIALRNPSKATSLTDLGGRLGLDVRVESLDKLRLVTESNVVISTIPGSADVSLESLNRSRDAVLLDAAYDVWPSPRALEWKSSGGRTVSGLSMLAFQALKQVRIFTAEAPDVPLVNEAEVAAAMFASVGLDELGL